MSFLKDDPGVRRARLAPVRRYSPQHSTDTVEAGLIAAHNRIGGLLMRLGEATGIAPPLALAVWMVECGGAGFVRGRPILRFENHKFHRLWGKDNETRFDKHFQFGGHGGIEGRPWEQHRFRASPGTEWRRFHGDQEAERAVLAFAARLAGRETACRCASFGGPQIMGFNHDLIGYGSASDMARAFSRSERWQVCGFFDFCRAKDLVSSLRTGDWHAFAAVYNGPGNAGAYAARMADAHARALALV